jgi:hypothetical protein
MIKLAFVLLLSSSLSHASSVSCYPLYQAEAERIQKKDGFTDHIGGQFYVNNGQLGYFPGIPVQGKIANWARDLVDAIKWGPYWNVHPDADPRNAWLEDFRVSVRKDCDLDMDKHDKLQSMLNELMEDGTFCPGGKMLESTFFKPKANFKKVFKQAVKENRFPQYCQSKAVVNDSFREVKEVEEKDSKQKVKGSQKQ